jgi:hypothetical protein
LEDFSVRIGAALGLTGLGVTALLACNGNGSTNTPVPFDGSDDTSLHRTALPDGAADGACANDPPPGLTPVAAAPAGGSLASQVVMALDENDDPLFAYLTLDASKDAALYFTRWDRCAGAFTTPLLVDGGLGPLTTLEDQRALALAYDTATLTVSIAYQSVVPIGTDLPQTTWLATQGPNAASFVRQQVSIGASAQSPTASPAVAMRDGNVYLAYVQSFACGDAGSDVVDDAGGDAGSAGSCARVWFLESASDPAVDAGTADATVSDAAASDSGSSTPIAFTRTPVPYQGAVATARSDSLSLAVNAIGEPAVAFYTAPAGSAQLANLLYWRSDYADAIAVTSSGSVPNATVDVSLAFDGTSPRVAGHLVADTSGTYDITFVASTDGTAWSSPVHLPSESASPGTRGLSTALAVPAPGDATVASDDPTDASPCGPPYLAQSSDGGQTWAACGADATKSYGFVPSSVNAAYGRARAAGTLSLGFANGPTKSGAASIAYWQAP